jgi:hypothetical protein
MIIDQSLLSLRFILALSLLFLLRIGNKLIWIGRPLHPQLLRHLQDLPTPLHLLQVQLERRKLHPRTRQGRKSLTIFLVDLPHTVQLAQLLLELNVTPEDLLLGADTDGSPVGFTGFGEVVASEAKIGIVDP